jgi:Cu(I)/Ag(I) efflux system membrane protein CusA/SilA
LRNNPEALTNILIPTNSGESVPLGELSSIEYIKGPQVIKSENTFLVNYITFGTKSGFSDGEVVKNARAHLNSQIQNSELQVPSGVSYKFGGNYQNQIRATKRLSILVPVVLVVIFLIIYFQFQKVPTTLLVFSGILISFAGGFIVMWLYGEPGFMDFSLFGTNMRTLFNIQTVYLSVAVWVGFIALFGIATDNGVIMATYLEQNFRNKNPKNIHELNDLVVNAGNKRIRPCLMTTATTLLALLPILSSTGRGANVMQPMAIPILGGMTVQLLTLFVIPVVYRVWRKKEI